MTKEEIIELARQAGFERLGHDDCDYVCYPDEIEAFAKLVAEKEREECAKFFTENDTNLFWGSQVASLIRARGQAWDDCLPIYTTPKRKPLTDKQIADIVREASHESAIRREGSTSMRIARAIEAAHGIKE